MLKLTFSVLLTASMALAQAGPYAQCGGQSWTGATTCQAGCVWPCTLNLRNVYANSERLVVQLDLHILQSVLFPMLARIVDCVHHAKQYFRIVHKDHSHSHYHKYYYNIHKIQHDV